MGGIILTGFWLVASALGIGLGLAVYGLPTIVAVWRKSPDIVPIFIVNLFGALFVPWWIALGMALWSSERRGGVTVIQATNVSPAPYAALPAVAHSSARVPVLGALPAAPASRPVDQPPPQPAIQRPMSSPSQVDVREDRSCWQRPPSSPGPGFAPPVPYSEAPSTSPTPQLRSSDRGW